MAIPLTGQGSDFSASKVNDVPTKKEVGSCSARQVKPVSHDESAKGFGVLAFIISGVVMLMLSAILWPIGAACGVPVLATLGQISLAFGLADVLMSIIGCCCACAVLSSKP